MTLEPLEPGEALALYTESREYELAERTVEMQEKILLRFVEWLRAEVAYPGGDRPTAKRKACRLRDGCNSL